ncbi:ankyrin repeat domain-containing protein 35 [Rhea pennata]|uniref:ankyrin repeat domain-containing protein 35 n=1 Tax=Rhea pennata TaxID=8795 RepID=UPI002E2751EB
MKKMFPHSSSRVAAESWSERDQKLLEAVEKGDAGRVAALAARGAARPAKRDAAGRSAFHLAASKGLPECLRLLLARGAPAEAEDGEGSSALHLAAAARQPRCVEVLLQHGASEGHVDGQSRTPLHRAASSGCASSALLLCARGAPLDAADGNGQTPLMITARGNHAAVCAQLLQRGADPNLADKDMKSALILARENCSVEAAELLLSHGAAVASRDRAGRDARHYAGQAPSRSLRRLLRAAPRRGNGAARPGSPETQAAPACDGTDSSEEEEEEEEEDRGVEERRCRREDERADVLQPEQQLATKTQEREQLLGGRQPAARGIREREQLLPGTESDARAEPSRDGRCLILPAEHVQEPRGREEEEEEQRDEPEAARGRLRELEGHLEAPLAASEGDERRLRALLAPFLARLRDACARLREEKLGAFARSAALRKEAEEALGREPRGEAVSADAVRKSRAAWEKLALGLEQALSRADESSAELLRRCRPLLETLRAPLSREQPGGPFRGAAPSRESGMATPEEVNLGRPENSRSRVGATESEAEERRRARSSKPEEEALGLKESNGKLLRELARLGRERERLREELRGLRERDEAARLRRRVAALRDGPGAQAREKPGGAGGCVLQELHRKLDGLARMQREASQLVSQMEGEDEAPGDAPRPPGEGGRRDAGEAAARSRRETAPGSPDGARALRRELAVASAEAARWAEAAAREREARALRAAVRGLQTSVEKLSAQAGELARACRDKEGKIKKLLAETEKLSAEVLAVRSESARLQLRLEVQQKNHQDVVAVYRRHLLDAAQGSMDAAVHAALLRIPRAGEA